MKSDRRSSDAARPASSVVGALSLTLLCACGAAPTQLPPAAAGGKAGAVAPRLVPWAKPARLVPELDLSAVDTVAVEEGRQRLLVSGLRIAVRDSGRVERADERFTGATVRSLSLPPRLGGGFLFYQADSQGTRLWRAKDWTARLEPLSQLGAKADEVIIGFDRLYVRTEGTNQLLGVDADTGTLTSRGLLPAAGAVGAMSFADGWRAVADTELRGPMASFDGGTSWSPLPIAERVEGAGVEQGDPVLYVSAGQYRVDMWGKVQFVLRGTEDGPETTDGDAEPSAADPAAQPHPLGKQPLRAAVLTGWPDSTSTAVVARHGAVARLSLPDGEVLGLARRAFPELDAECTGARVGAGFGFICGESRGSTTIYAYRRPLRLRRVARFDAPRFVSPSGNGALVVRGGCGPEAKPTGEIRTYCIIDRLGRQHEVGVRGDLGAERVVALGDGRVVVLVPPRIGAPGRLTIIRGESLKTVPLRFPKEPRRAVRLAKRGLWLEGFQQRGAKTIGGWVEAGGPVLGVTVSLAGEVKLGRPVDRGGEVLLAGRFALVAAEAEGGTQSTDGGKTWLEFELPRLPESPADAATRGCSPVGCALRGWLRLGWGEPRSKDDLAVAPKPAEAFARPAATRSVRTRCHLVGPSDGARGTLSGPRTRGAATFGDWRGFGGLPPPELGSEEVGVAKGTSGYDPVPAHVYVWGPKGADFTRAGWWTVRFDDRFDGSGVARRSARTRPPWPDRITAGEAIGAESRGRYWRWAARLDPSGQSALLSACRGSACRLFAVTAGRAILPLRDSSGGFSDFRTPVAQGAVRVGESWYFLTETEGDTFQLWRAELGVARLVRTYPRLSRRRYGLAEAPRLVRRLVGRQVGLLVTVPADPSAGGRAGEWVVLPVTPATGELGEPIALGPADLAGQLPPPCASHEDGWLIDGPLDGSTVLDLVGVRSYLDAIEFRLRVDPASRCVDAIAARTGRALSAHPPTGRSRRSRTQVSEGGGPVVDLVVRAQNSPERWSLRCETPRGPTESPLDRLLGGGSDGHGR